VPRPRSNWIPRPRLLQRLDHGLTARPGLSSPQLTLVSAPAGYGKTTLLASWIAQAERPVAWLSLDEGDDDPACFLAYLTAALETLPGFLAPDGRDDLEVSGEARLTVLVNRVTRLVEPAILVLDDFHRVTAPTVVGYVAYLLDHLPSTLCIVIATRADPPLPIARLRAGGQLTEIRQADLRFTPAEAAAFLHHALDLDLTQEQVAALADRTEGWIAGLHMAAASLRHREDVGSFITSFAGSHRYVMDYLLEEVLGRQPAEVQRFLLRTSILDRLSAPLCDAVLLDPPPTGSQSVLEDLEQANLFITPLDDHRIWYRYHRLFADLLRRQLSQRHPDVIPELHARASRWYEDQALLPDSIDHALNAGDFERSAMLIERVIEPLIKRSELMTLRNWLGALPEEVLHRRPQLCAYHAWLLLLAGEPVRRVDARIAALREHVGCDSGQLKAVQALVSISQGRIDGVAMLADQALQTLTREDGFWYSVAAWLQDLLRMSDGDLRDEDGEPLRHMVDAHLGGENVLLCVIGLCNVGELRIKQGRLREAQGVFERALSRAEDAAGERLPIAGEPLTWLGELARERNDLAAAERYLADGLELVRQWGPVAAIEGYTALARLQQAQGDRAGADEALDEASRLAVSFDATEMDDHLVALARARIAALRGDFEAVERWATSRGLDSIDPDDLQIDVTIELHLRKYELVVLGLARILEGRPRVALTFLDPLLAYVTEKGRWGLGIEILALQAVALQMVGERERALSRLERALSRAEPERYARLFIDMGDPMAQLLYRAAQAGLCPEYAGRLLAAFPQPSVAEPADQPRQPLIEPLSDRELEVLASIAEGLTNQETAQRLCISERTVKWHASNIYGKLQVGNRTEAVARARSLGILPA
jgi:LuxR family maltose regulon positive regulatory protein